MPTVTLPMDELRRRVRECEALLGVARGLARDEMRDPARCERARDRIVGIMREVDALFPGLTEPPSLLNEAELVAPSMRPASLPSPVRSSGRSTGDSTGGPTAEPRPDSNRTEAEALDDCGQDAGNEDDEEGEGEWDVDLHKLGAAVQNEALMSNIPEVDRAWFKAMAEKLIEADERAKLRARVSRAFLELSETMKKGVEDAGRQLAVALTFEGLKAKQRQ